ncbi:TPA: DNA packaging protein [Stenotrophomonas maltophilia]|uniref:DNA packaging protein gp17 (Terminase) n=1 Tax=Stenotrophomonas maltophilia (strain K279a) TaxID=522373 RepID=B2FMU8_STRMK|nr:putative DNA packaging protein gp17 (terminase) [Stenotrophomonas maltophilia K279a]HEL4451326.1 DNA packaging protein [Stenotrophomonas maltophilia]
MEELSDQDASRIIEKLGDRWWRLNNLYYITDKFGRRVQFKLNEVQADLDDNLHTLNLALKSRQHGITTWACIRALDMALFKKNTKAGVVAHTAGDAAKFFRSKVLYAYDNLPDWLKKIRPAVRRDMRDGVLELANGSSIEVSVSHRGGTLTFLHISEYGPMCAMYPERAGEVASGALNAIASGNIVVIESTAYGAAGDFYERCQMAIELDRQIRAGTAKLTAMDYRFHFYPWFRDPINELDPDGVTLTAEDEAYFAKVEAEMNYTLRPEQKAWYVKKAAEQRDKMKREHPSTPEEAFQASTEGAYYGKEMASADSSGRITDLPINPQVPIHTFWDIGRSDATSIWFMQENGPWLDFVDFYENSGFGVAHYAKVLKERGYLYGKHYWPHDGANEDWSANENRVQVAAKLGVKPVVVVPRINDITEGIDMVRNMLPRCRFDRVRCGPPKAGEGRGGLEALRRYTKVWNEKTETYSDLPFHNWASNPADAFRQAAQGYVSSSGRRVGESRGMANDNWRTA